MTSFKQFLNENEYLFPKQAALLVIKNCQQFLKETGFEISSFNTVHNAFFRGINNAENTGFAHRFPRLDRKPKDSSKELHKLLDNHFMNHFGFQYRSAGTFASAKHTITLSYGHPCLIFPLDGYSYVWSSQISDAYQTFGEADHLDIYKQSEEFKKIASDLGYSSQDLDSIDSKTRLYEMISDWLEQEMPYTDKNLKGAFVEKFGETPEVMFNCSSKGYYTVSMFAGSGTAFTKRFYNEFLNELRKIL